jgi:hypothetical protein
VSLRAHPIEEVAVLPSGRRVTVSIGIADDPYIPTREVDTVTLVVRGDEEQDDEVVAAVNTVLEPEHASEARALLRDVVSGLESGGIEPTAGGLEPYADRIPDVR